MDYLFSSTWRRKDGDVVHRIDGKKRTFPPSDRSGPLIPSHNEQIEMLQSIKAPPQDGLEAVLPSSTGGRPFGGMGMDRSDKMPTSLRPHDEKNMMTRLISISSQPSAPGT
ncbi:hypothetical protein Mhar_0750 [Methanothrix harundinacea 6Ac]|uniref:Uncharacterized protein n=1 Tax=Methanothrix harundinacea (strain 6Ac) TaxID=1110509 RepID=G7WKU0_METH6|nr:hypothetical protein Mhar_0750 [Methanothrix harundinacea 6Ac]